MILITLTVNIHFSYTREGQSLNMRNINSQDMKTSIISKELSFVSRQISFTIPVQMPLMSVTTPDLIAWIQTLNHFLYVSELGMDLVTAAPKHKGAQMKRVRVVNPNLFPRVRAVYLNPGNLPEIQKVSFPLPGQFPIFQVHVGSGDTPPAALSESLGQI